MRKLSLIALGIVVLGGCSYQASTVMGQSTYDDYFTMCTHNRDTVNRFESYNEMADYCDCRAHYIAQNTTYAEHRDMVLGEFKTGLTTVSARVLNGAEKYCELQKD
jgi:hypothetical protein